ncbi:EsaB/YukD family protein [Metabacillus niabensis]|uniref:Ubiquitin-like protein YukD n=1 Tax=Metabacillus niabensis TaxID=324854 RepID=A0ABT9Z2Y3_9BACI|nr:EsaB/YukD family protein [Metabacillus niabensis]MDQ0226621.1 putative ubiquitin-like protein YukD [Metabacillus niabensis]PAD69032.1 ubiquitin [Bacillus sp. 7586-K]
MYIEITVDLKNYQEEIFDLRLSNYHSVKKLLDIVWQTKQLTGQPKEGYWIRVVNKNKVADGTKRLIDVGITTGDRIEIL